LVGSICLNCQSIMNQGNFFNLQGFKKVTSGL
jgi:hypothetical protein